MECPKEFDDIRPFYDSEFHDKMKVLVTEPGFEHAVRYVLRDICLLYTSDAADE